MQKYVKLAVVALLLVSFVVAHDGGSEGEDGGDDDRKLSALDSTATSVNFFFKLQLKLNF